MKNKNKTISTFNLLDENEFKNQLCFEACFASVIKGGVMPTYITHQQKQRLVNPINILSSSESKNLVERILLPSN